MTNVAATRSLLLSLGFLINISKSKLVPSTRCQFLGFILDSVSFQLLLSEQKKPTILQLLEQFSLKRSCKIRDFAKFLGTPAAACFAIDYGWCHYKLMERHKYLALLISDGNFDARMIVPTCLSGEFAWWSSHISRASIPIRRHEFARIIFSDASLSGWGAACDGVSVHGF